MANQLNATGRPDENLSAEVFGPFWLSTEQIAENRKFVSISLQKGQLRANAYYNPQNSTNLEVPLYQVLQL